MTVNPFTFLYNIFQLLLKMANLLYEFLFKEITIGSFTFTPLFAIGGGVMITLIITRLIKQYVPFT